MYASVLLAALAFAPADAHLARETARGLVELHTPRDAGTLSGRLAAHYLLDAVRVDGVDARLDNFLAETPEGRLRFSNVVCDIASDSAAPWIVLLSHFDTKRGTRCPGANDGASTSGLLVALARLLAANPPAGFNMRLIWTDGEECFKAYGREDGLWGARHAASSLRTEGLSVRAVVCLDMLGDRDLVISVPRNGSAELRRLVHAAAARAGIAEFVLLDDSPVKDDHVPFIEEGFPAVDLIDFEFGSAPGLNDYWHTDADTMDKVSEASLFVAGRLVLSLVEELRPCGVRRPHSNAGNLQ